MPFSIRRPMVPLLLLASTGAAAMSIGEIDVSSHLGEPLRARVPLVLDEGTLPRDDCIRIAGSARHHPDLANARVTLVSQGGRYFAAIATANPVDDPMLDLTLRSEECGASMQKDFVILLLPKDMGMPIVPPETAKIAETVDREVVPPRRPKAPKQQPRPRAVAKTPPAPPAPPPRKVAARYSLKLDYGHGEFGRLAEAIVLRRQAAANAKPLGQQASELPTAAPPDRLVLQAPPEDFRPLDQGGQDASASGVATPASEAGPVAGTGAAAARTGVGAVGPTAPVAPPSSRAWYAWSALNLSILLVLLLLALAIAYWLKQRTPRSRFMDDSPADLDGMGGDRDDPGHPLLSLGLPPLESRFEEPSIEAPPAAALHEALEPRPPSQSAEVLEFTPAVGAKIEQETKTTRIDNFSVEHRDSVENVMELAEVMLAFGRSGQAIETLSQHIRDNPRQALDPWLKLLDLYHQSDLRDEFEALSANLHKSFNVAMTEWGDYAANAERPIGPLTLEALPHIMSRMTDTWGTQEGLDYLERLLEDNRDGQRLGFSMPIVRDILLLRDILRQTCPTVALSI